MAFKRSGVRIPLAPPAKGTALAVSFAGGAKDEKACGFVRAKRSSAARHQRWRTSATREVGDPLGVSAESLMIPGKSRLFCREGTALAVSFAGGAKDEKACGFVRAKRSSAARHQRWRTSATREVGDPLGVSAESLMIPGKSRLFCREGTALAVFFVGKRKQSRLCQFYVAHRMFSR